jgi:predicted ATPase
MITHLHVENFKCLQKVDVDLGPFTVLIGPNDSGKSSILDAISLLGQTAIAPQLAGVFSGPQSLDNLVWQRDVNRKIVWQLNGYASGQSLRYTLELSPTGGVSREVLEYRSTPLFDRTREGDQTGPLNIQIPGAAVFQVHVGPEQTAFSFLANNFANDVALLPIRKFVHSLSSVKKYCLEPHALRTGASRGEFFPSPNGSASVLNPDGDNLAAVVDTILTSPDRSWIIGLEQVLHQEIPTLVTVSTRASDPQGQRKSLQFGLAGTQPVVSIPADLASDGAILLTAFLAMAYSDTPEMVFIEEPENGLHYSRLKLVIEHFRKMSTGQVGNRPRQVIITTHSPLLLNFCRPEEVRICLRDTDRGTTVKPMTEVPNIKELLEEFGTGELWYLLGEEKLLKESKA